jgi:hypothetical protein
MHRFGGDVTLLNGDLDIDTGDLAVTIGGLDVPAGDVSVGAIGEFKIGNRMLSVSGGPPDAGAHVVGDRYVNNGGVFAGITGWVCVVSGTPGVWSAYGLDPSLRYDVEEDFIAPAGTVLPSWLIFVQSIGAGGQCVGAYVNDAPNGEYAMTMGALAEIQQCRLGGGDNRWIDLQENPVVSFRVKVDIDTAYAATDEVYIGVAMTHNDVPTAITRYAWFRLGSAGPLLTVFAMAEDGTTAPTDLTTAQLWLNGQYAIYSIDFSNLADVRFLIDGIDVTPPAGVPMPLMDGTLVQQYIQCWRSNSGNQHVVTVDSMRLHGERP